MRAEFLPQLMRQSQVGHRFHIECLIQGQQSHVPSLPCLVC